MCLVTTLPALAATTQSTATPKTIDYWGLVVLIKSLVTQVMMLLKAAQAMITLKAAMKPAKALMKMKLVRILSLVTNSMVEQETIPF